MIVLALIKLTFSKMYLEKISYLGNIIIDVDWRCNFHKVNGIPVSQMTCRKHPRSCHHSRLITGCVTRTTRRMPLVAQELLTFPEHPSSSLVFCEVFCRSLFVLLYLFFVHCVVCPSIYGFWLPLWYYQDIHCLILC